MDPHITRQNTYHPRKAGKRESEACVAVGLPWSVFTSHTHTSPFGAPEDGEMSDGGKQPISPKNGLCSADPAFAQTLRIRSRIRLAWRSEVLAHRQGGKSGPLMRRRQLLALG